jgi:uncharacterized protein (TIGR00251 family)
MSCGWVRYDAVARVLRLSIHAQPNARKTAIAGLHGADLKVTIAAPAVDNKANIALAAFVAEALDIPASTVSVRFGATSRRKTLEIRNAAPELESRALALADRASR